MQLKQKPYNLLLLFAFFLIILSFLTHDAKSPIDLHFHDFYLIIEDIYILWCLAFILFVLWTIYFLSKRILFSVILIWAHLITTIIPIAFIMFYPLQKRYYDYTESETFSSFEQINSLIYINSISFFSGQLLFVTHLIGGVIKIISSSIKK